MTDEIQGFFKVTSAMKVMKIIDPHSVDIIKTTFCEKYCESTSIFVARCQLQFINLIMNRV